MRVLKGLDWLLEAAMWGGASMVVVLLFAGPSLIGAKAEPRRAVAAPPAATTSGSASAAPQIFTQNCGSCHTLAAAQTTGTTGPNLDEAAPDRARVVEVVTNGSGIMPPFEGRLSSQEIEALADFVAGS